RHEHGGHHVHAHGHDLGADVLGQHACDLVDGDLGFTDHRVLVHAVVELGHDLRGTGTGGGVDGVYTFHALHRLFERLGDLTLDHLGGGTVVAGGDHDHGQVHLGEELTLGGDRSERPEEQDRECDEKDKRPVSERHRRKTVHSLFASASGWSSGHASGRGWLPPRASMAIV